jgi:hypothetical protein
VLRTQVVVLGRGPRPHRVAGRSGEPVVLHHDAADEGGLPALLDPDRHVLVLAERRDAVQLGRVCAVVGVQGDALPVVGRALPHGPFGLDLLARHVAEQSAAPASVLAWLDELAAATWSGAWLRQVGGLEDPAPRLGQHVRSWFGGNGFLVEHAPVPRVVPVPRGDGQRPAVRGAETVPAAALRRAGEDGRLDRLVARSAGESRRRYGCDAVELAALPAVLPPLPAEDALPACPVCALPVPHDVCPYCRVHVAPALSEAL